MRAREIRTALSAFKRDMHAQIVLLVVLLLPTTVFGGAFWDGQRKAPRFKLAERHEKSLADAFREAGATWPPAGVFFRAFKHEKVLELWALPRQGEPWVKVKDYPVCAASGVLGPKRQQGDLQVPEGFYHIDRFNPWSRFHLSLGINYPNPVDLARTGKGVPPGGDIFIHGGCATIGCLPVRDEPMEELYLAAVAARDKGQQRIPVHVFPCRMDRTACRVGLARIALAQPGLAAFWDQLRAGYAAFEDSNRLPLVVAGNDGGYRVMPAVDPAMAAGDRVVEAPAPSPRLPVHKVVSTRPEP